jgi:6-phosphogluconolactonase/glucosamine-6-phosphate isomerase/deaminase
MQISVHENHEQLSQKASEILLSSLEDTLLIKDRAIFIPSAGKSPTLLYKILAEHKNRLDWQKIIVVQMDEYLSNNNDELSFKDYLNNNLIRPLKISNFLSLPKLSCNVVAKKYIDYHEQIIKDLGGIDIALHGIGINGHIGFNEPGSLPDQASGVFVLAPSTVSANQSSLSEQVCPPLGYSLGLKILAEAKKNIIIASGPSKKNAVQKLLDAKDYDYRLPASILADKNTIFLTEKDLLNR